MNDYKFSENFIFKKNGNEFSVPKVLPGPMEGIMDDAFCQTLNDLKYVEHWVTPFVNVNNSVPGKRHLRKFLRQFSTVKENGNDDFSNITVQLLGHSSELLTKTAENIMELDIAGINFNAGCPSLRVIKSGNGSGLLKKENLTQLKDIHRSLATVCDEVIPYSIKLRTGFDNPDAQQLILPELLAVANVDYLIMHFRTAIEMYQKIPASEAMKRFKMTRKLCGDIPLIASGDIVDLKSAQSVVAEANVDGVMIARELIRNPALLKQLRSDSISVGNEDIMKFVNAFIKHLKVNGNNEIITSRLIEIVKFAWGNDSQQFAAIKQLAHREKLVKVLKVIDCFS